MSVRWGVLGTGKIVAKGGAGLKQSGNGVWLGVAGRNADNGRLAAAQYEVPKAYASYRELIDDPDIDAVYIALLNHLHKEWAVEACLAGKHVLIEKPFALTVAEALEITRAAERTGVLVQEAHVWRYHPAHEAVKRWVEEGRIGELVRFRGHFSFAAPQDSTRWVKAWGGGSLFDVGCYPVAWSRFMMGDEPVAADGDSVIDGLTGVDRRFVGTLYYEGGRTAQIDSALDMPHGSFYELLGTRGRAEVSFRVDAAHVGITARLNGETQHWSQDRITPFRLQAESFASAVLGRAPLEYGAGDAIAQTEAVEALIRSADSKRREQVRSADTES